MKSISLFTLVEQYRALEQLDIEALDEQALKDTLEGLTGEITIKATNVGAFVLNVEAYAQAAADAAKKLAERAKRMQRRADVMREYLRESMKALNLKKIEGEQFTLTRKANPPAVIIQPDTELAEQYLQPPDPLVSLIVKGVMELPRDIEATLSEFGAHFSSEAEAEQFALQYLLVTPTEMADVIARHLPPRAANKKAIGDALKAKVDIPGCSLDQGERLEIKP